MKTKLFHFFSGIFSLMFLFSGLNKLFQFVPIPPDLPVEMAKDNAAFVEIAWLMPLIAIAEIMGAILILIPRFRALGALVVFPLMVGILINHATVAPDGLMMVLVLWAILLWMMWENADKYLGLIK